MKKVNRIRKNEEFNKIIAQRHSFSNSSFVLYVSKKALDNARVGISVSKKLGIAVERNKIKRQLREMIKETYNHETGEYDLIVIVRPSYKQRDYALNRSYLEKLIKKAII